jgi:uncharacterized protein (DUF488 family)
MPTVLTIGHSTRTWKVFLDLLRAHRVERVIDVRSIPCSRHNPQFDQETLRTKLRAARIGYGPSGSESLGDLSQQYFRGGQHGDDRTELRGNHPRCRPSGTDAYRRISDRAAF